MEKSSIKTISVNKKAFHEYFILEKIEAGISLSGTEVKSIRKMNVNLKDSYISVMKREAFVYNMHISPYEQGNIFNKDPIRPRKLLLHKKEIDKLNGMITRDGLTVIPLSVYFKGGLVKVEVAVARGKKLYDKREDSAKKDSDRDIQRKMKNN